MRGGLDILGVSLRGGVGMLDISMSGVKWAGQCESVRDKGWKGRLLVLQHGHVRSGKAKLYKAPLSSPSPTTISAVVKRQ